jgi:hypothetical protein
VAVTIVTKFGIDEMLKHLLGPFLVLGAGMRLPAKKSGWFLPTAQS